MKDAIRGLVLLAIVAGWTPRLPAAEPLGPEFPPELVDFVPYVGNPVFAGTGKDTWDRLIRERGWILREPDGLHWTRHPANPVFKQVWTNVQDQPVLSPGPEPFDRQAIAMDQVIKYRGRYYGYYHATNQKPWHDWTTCVATSTDLVHWKKYPKNPVVANDKSSPIVVHDGRQFRLYTMHPDVRVYFPRQPAPRSPD